jgi:hypothetical protein
MIDKTLAFNNMWCVAPNVLPHHVRAALAGTSFARGMKRAQKYTIVERRDAAC